MKIKLLIVCLLLSACGPGRPKEATNQLRFAVSNDPKSFDPHLADDSSTGAIRDLTAGFLLRTNRLTDEVQPQLAESFRIIDDNRAIAIHMRPSLKFSDGSPLTAVDVVRTLKGLLANKEATIGDAFIEGAPQITSFSPLDLEVRYKDFKPRIDRIFDEIAIVPAAPAKLPASAGPFFVEKYIPGQFVQLARNPHYWKSPLPRLDSIRIDIQGTSQIVLNRFLQGELHLIDRPSPEVFAQIAKRMPNAARDLGPSLDSEFFWFNETTTTKLPAFRHAWYNSALFRRAISMAVHRDDIARNVYRGYAHPAAGPESPADKFWFNSALQPLPTDPNAALKLLTAEGFILKDNTLRDRQGNPVEFSLVTQAGKTVLENTAAIVAEDLRRIGIHVNVVKIDANSLIERIQTTFDYEAALWNFNQDPDPLDQLNVWPSSAPIHAWNPKQSSPATIWEARIDEIVKIQTSEPSREARKKAWDEFQKIMAEQQPLIYLVNPDYLCAVSPLLKGMQPAQIPPQLWWNIEQISF